MTSYLSYIQDVAGNNYLGIKIDKLLIDNFLFELEDILGDEFETYSKLQQERDHGTYHITVINVMEYNQLNKQFGMDKFINSLDYVLKYPIDDIQMLGIGTANRKENTTYFIVCRSQKLDAIRKKYSLPEHDFHITLGFLYKDVFGVRKNEVMKKKSKFINILKEEYLKKETLNFIKDIDGFSENKESDIIPISISEDYLKVKIDDIILNIGLMDNNKLGIYNRFKDDKNSKRLSTSELISFIIKK